MYLLSYFKSLPHSIANQGHSIVPSLHKHSPFSFKKKSEYVSQPHGFSPTTKWFISSRKTEQTGKDDLLQCAPASCYSSAPSSTDLFLVTPGLLSCPQQWATYLHDEYSWDTGGPLTRRGWEVHLLFLPTCRAEDWTSETPSEIKLMLQYNEESFWLESHQAWEEHCLLALQQQRIYQAWTLPKNLKVVSKLHGNLSTRVKCTRWDVKTHLTSEYKVYAYF